MLTKTIYYPAEDKGCNTETEIKCFRIKKNAEKYARKKLVSFLREQDYLDQGCLKEALKFMESDEFKYNNNDVPKFETNIELILFEDEFFYLKEKK